MGHVSKGVFRLNVRDAWRVPKEGPKGLVRRRVERGFRGDGFRDRWRSPKDGPAGVSAEASKGGIRQGFGKVSKGSERGGEFFRGHASVSDGLRKVFGAGLFEKGFPERTSKGWPSGLTFEGASGRVGSEGVFEGGLEGGLPEGFHGGRLWSLDSKWAAEIHRLDRTDRNAQDDEGRGIKDLQPGWA